MATERLPMRNMRELLRLRWQQGRSVRETALSVGASVGVVSETTSRAKAAELDWEGSEKLPNPELERLLSPSTAAVIERPKPDPVYIHTELKRPGVTLELLHLEYLQQHPDGYRYTVFCDHYRKWQARHRV
jgi:transposase